MEALPTVTWERTVHFLVYLDRLSATTRSLLSFNNFNSIYPEPSTLILRITVLLRHHLHLCLLITVIIIIRCHISDTVHVVLC